MDKIVFLVQGSAELPYEVSFIKESEKELRAYCNCAAGIKKTHCKHRFDILEGNTSAIVSDNANGVPVVLDWLAGTSLESMIGKLLDLTKQQADIKKMIDKTKKDVSKAMNK